LSDFCAKDRAGLIARARAIKALPRPLPRNQVFERLMGRNDEAPSGRAAEVPLTQKGREVSRLKIDARGIALRFKHGVVPENRFEDLAKVLQRFLDETS
jgi:hypothetical protein